MRTIYASAMLAASSLAFMSENSEKEFKFMKYISHILDELEKKIEISKLGHDDIRRFRIKFGVDALNRVACFLPRKRLLLTSLCYRDLGDR